MTPFKILIVDDDPLSRLLLRRLITPITSEIIFYTACSGEEALEIYLANTDLDLILMDIKMPKMNGIDAMIAIKKYNPNIPIIAQTAYVYTKEEGMKFGFDDCLPKPIRRNDLVKSLQIIIDNRKQS